MISLEKFLLVLVVFNFEYLVAGDELKGEAADNGAMWFGPRVGKRSSRLGNDDNRQTFLRLLEAADALKFYYDQLPYYEAQADDPETKVTKKVIFTPKLGRALESQYHDVDFTPRLGRRLSDELPVTPPDQDMYRADPEQIDNRSKYFSPRLGRTINFSPRLGRELDYNVYPSKIRLARSPNTTKTTKAT
uniref:Diapause hormone-pheromone biosynthesis-activating neuropeptide n=1 Tax=Carposina sasakii TaxID=252295 RepID=A0A8K1IMK3_CARSA|nr:diapause hormone-pheromone biosynthesis-activating neuropeptide [Carposina sasakii]